jgi:hypothetical protein
MDNPSRGGPRPSPSVRSLFFHFRPSPLVRYNPAAMPRASKNDPRGRTAALVNGLGLLALAGAILVPRLFPEAEEAHMAVRAVGYTAFVVLCAWSGLISWQAHTEDRWARMVSLLVFVELFLAVWAPGFVLAPS